MKSPVTFKGEAILEKSIGTLPIIEGYKRSFNLDVKGYFKGNEHIEIYKCCDTGYRFYYPFDISGDSDFYAHLQQFDFYYMPWKWEHQMTLELITPGDSILEVGCGKGYFLKKVNEAKGVNCVGIELNESVAMESKDVNIINTSIEKYSEGNKNKFDIVCSFQVLEHVAFVRSFLNAKIDCLKKGGKLVICVPNNDSYLKYTDGILNKPPHHMGLWEEKSLTALEKYYPMKLVKILFEPLQEYHLSDYLYVTLVNKIGKYPARALLKTLSLAGLKKIIRREILNRANSIKGHSIMAIFEKY